MVGGAAIAAPWILGWKFSGGGEGSVAGGADVVEESGGSVFREVECVSFSPVGFELGDHLGIPEFPVLDLQGSGFQFPFSGLCFLLSFSFRAFDHDESPGRWGLFYNVT